MTFSCASQGENLDQIDREKCRLERDSVAPNGDKASHRVNYWHRFTFWRIQLTQELKMLNLYRNQFDCFEKRWWDRWNPKWIFLYSTRKISKEFSRCQDEVLVPGNRQHQLSRTSLGRRSEFSNQSINQKKSTLLRRFLCRKIPRWVTLQSDNWFCSNYANKMSICTEVIHPVVRQQSY